MSRIKRTITGDKAGMLEHLRAQQAQWRDSAASTDLPRYRRAEYTGRVEGVQFAIRALEDWAAEPADEGANPMARCCRCGYLAWSVQDLADHIDAASRIDDGQHHG